MITRVFSNLAFFSTVKYDILNGKYLIPQGPKRPLSAFLIFSQEGRKKLSQSKSQSSKTDVAAQAKSFGQAWKALNPEQKKKYEDEAKKLKDKYQLEKNVYSAKYKDPFKRVTANNLIQKQFYEKNKFASLQEGSKAFSDYKKQLKEEDLQKYNKSAEELNSQKQKISSMYTIPELKYKDFNAYLRHLRAKNPEIPAKKDLKETQLQKFQKEYEELSAKYSQDLKQFAKSFNLKPTDLISMINKLKNPEEKLDEEGRKLKDTQKKLKEEAMQDLKKSQESLKLQKAKIKSRAQKIVQKQIKQLQKAVEKQKKIVARADAKFKPKIEKIERQKKQLDTEKTVKKEFEKKEATEQGSKRKSVKKTTQSKEQPKVQSSQPAQQAQPAQSTQSK